MSKTLDGINPMLIDACGLASEIILHDTYMPEYLSYKLEPSDTLPMLVPATHCEWINGMQSAFDVEAFNELLDRVIQQGNISIWRDKAIEVLVDNNGVAPTKNSPELSAYLKARKRLCSVKHGSHWIALTIVAIARMIAKYGVASFSGWHWSEESLSWLKLEEHLLNGQGALFAQGIVSLESKLIEGGIVEVLGDRLTRTLAEMSLNASNADFFLGSITA